MLGNRAFLWGNVLLVALLIGSGLQPFSRGTWWLEIFPILVVLPVLWYTREHYRLSTLLYGLIFLHALILMVGGHYTYARVPLGFWIRDTFALMRNPYDKIGHFAQGLVPAIAAREILIRGQYVKGRGMLAFIVVCIALAISAAYELIEWGAAVALGQGADEFLATQGDPFDTQSDMLMALIGAICALLALTHLHDKLIRHIPPNRL
ncbi:MAG: DUF2238 domain-containing protein [Steroidobacteraceae bacterium]